MQEWPTPRIAVHKQKIAAGWAIEVHFSLCKLRMFLVQQLTSSFPTWNSGEVPPSTALLRVI